MSTDHPESTTPHADRTDHATSQPRPTAGESSEGLAGGKGLWQRLDLARRELLDLTARNRLLNTPRSRRTASTIEVVDELPDQVFRILVQDGRSMTFLSLENAPAGLVTESGDPGANDARDDASTEGEQTDESGEEISESETAVAAPDKAEEIGGMSDIDGSIGYALNQPEEGDLEDAGDEIDEPELAPRHTDSRLQTQLNSSTLQRRLLRIHHAAQTCEEEKGVNTLYLALGFLTWYESESSSKVRRAPLLLIPVRLERASATQPFRLRYTGEDISTNLSLQARLVQDFGVNLPDVPESEDVVPGDYFEQVRQTVSHMPRWEVRDDDIVLGFFSFAKLLMYRDLEPDSWPDGALTDHPLIQSLMRDGFRPEPPLCDENDLIDDVLDPEELVHVMDADSSQSIVIEEVKRGRNLVVHGPPGTGKSQTIANVIAAAVKEGLRVLFVAEKAAALNVVKDRLTRIGLGDMCLAVHSSKATRRTVLDSLDHTLKLDRPLLSAPHRTIAELRETVRKLNAHARIMHVRCEPSALWPYRVVGELVRLRAKGLSNPPFTLPDATSWTPDDLRDRLGRLRELILHIREIGTPRDHPWRGVERNAILPQDRDRLQQILPGVDEAIDSALSSAEELSRTLTVEMPQTGAGIGRLIRLARHIMAAPDMDRERLTDSVWSDRRHEISDLVQAGRRDRAAAEVLEPHIADVAWTTDVTEARRDMAAQGQSWFRFLYGRYRRAVATMRGIMKSPLPRTVQERLKLLDSLIEAQKTRRELEEREDLGRAAFGRLWRGPASNWTALEQIVDWVSGIEQTGYPSDQVRAICAGADLPADSSSLVDEAPRVAADLERAVDRIQQVVDILQLDVEQAFDDIDKDQAKTVEQVNLSDMRDRVQAWQRDPEGVTRWIAYRARDRQLREDLLDELADGLRNGTIEPDRAVDLFELAYYSAVMRRMVDDLPELASFQGLSHNEILKRFRDLDERRIKLAREEVALAHYERIPRGAQQIGEIGLIRGEINKKRRNLPIRQLLRRCANAITAIKPVFMMSPLSVAHFLEPGGIEFDLLLIDEASQVPPVDALGAIARCRRMVVVGDDRQLPPTRFFMRDVLGDEADGFEAEDDEMPVLAGDLESILGLCKTSGMSERLLRWHYRSRHHSLIALSNREFYDDRLYVVPSPHPVNEFAGLHFHYVEDGVYDRAGTRRNVVEASRVAHAVMEHARRFPDLTLGVGTFSTQQRDAIIDELERLRRADPQYEPFFAAGKPEPFFVKNLENVQGDERDVIFISVGYGRDSAGSFFMNFGPLSSEGGERRLNVLITRSRIKCVAFASIFPDEIDLARASGRGPRVLRAFLKYAKTGVKGLGIPTGGGSDSVFEDQVADAIRSCGFEVAHQVGVAGFFIDLAVRDPEEPGRFLLGIECDGATYHSARSARDRDRIRQNVLESRGWIIHRIWSTDWFHRSEDELRRTLKAIENARAELDARRRRFVESQNQSDEDDPHATATADKDKSVDERSEGIYRIPDEAFDDEESRISTPYEEASFSVPGDTPIHEIAVEKLAKIATRIVEVEGPIHIDGVADRVRILWGLSRTGSRIARAVHAAVDHAAASGLLVKDGPFLHLAGRDEIRVRDRSEVEHTALRSPSMLPPREIRACIAPLLKTHLGVTPDEMIVAVARQFGFRVTSPQLRAVISEQIDDMIDDGEVSNVEGRLHWIGEDREA